LKRHEKTISHEKAVHIAALVSDLWNVSKKVIQRDLKTPEVNKSQLFSFFSQSFF